MTEFIKIILIKRIKIVQQFKIIIIIKYYILMLSKIGIK